ncbi:MAG: hypothetical protein JNL24_07690 [Bacteroidia bacterium]|nr:hypothetical protein [Bacteroidia bacterium]
MNKSLIIFFSIIIGIYSCKKENNDDSLPPNNSTTNNPITLVQETFDTTSYILAGANFIPHEYYQTDISDVIIFKPSNPTLSNNTALIAFNFFNTSEHSFMYIHNSKLSWIAEDDTVVFFDADDTHRILRIFDATNSNFNMILEDQYQDVRSYQTFNNQRDWFSNGSLFSLDDISKILPTPVNNALQKAKDIYEREKAEIEKCKDNLNQAWNTASAGTANIASNLSNSINNLFNNALSKVIKYKVLNENAILSESATYPNGALTLTNVTGDVRVTSLTLIDSVYQDVPITPDYKTFGNMNFTANNFPISHSLIPSTTYNFSGGMMRIDYKVQNMSPPLMDVDTIQ